MYLNGSIVPKTSFVLQEVIDVGVGSSRGRVSGLMGSSPSHRERHVEEVTNFGLRKVRDSNTGTQPGVPTKISLPRRPNPSLVPSPFSPPYPLRS